MTDNLLPTPQRLEYRLPIRLGDLSGPQGNVFAVFGAIKSCGKQMASATGDTEWIVEAERLVDTFMQGTYDDGLQMLREQADWLDDDEWDFSEV